MPKRSLDDAELADGVEVISALVPAPKKSKKEKRKRTDDAKPVLELVASGGPQEIESKEARKERRRLKKLNRVEDSVEQNGTVEGENSNAQEESKDDKSARKAEKSRLKALKRAKKEGKPESTSEIEAPNRTTVSTPIPSGRSGDSYVEDAGLADLPQAEIDTFLAEKFITITDPLSKAATLRPITQFSYLPVSDPAHRAPFKDFKAPTPIQAAAWPFLLAGRDVIGVAETGSGKTMAFAVPCVRAISSLPHNQKNKGARAVVVSPTRELAMQSYEQITKLATVSGLQVVCVYGGVPKDEQRRALKTADIVVATPGRLNDLINEGCADLSNAKYVVLDEADRMLDKGFEEEIRKIINTTPAIGTRQTLMFTATWPESVRALAATFMTDPVKIAIGDNPTGDLRANARIVQRVEVVDPRNKEWRLLQLLKEYQSGAQKDDRILVFCLYKKEATRVEGFIRQKGFRVAGIHGDLSQEQRTRSLDAFKKGQTPVLVATDVAARGLDIPAVKLVINCTFPLTVEDYVHRIGRTGRAGSDGLAITLFTEHDKAQSGALINVLKAANQAVPEELLKFGTTVKKKGHEAYGAFFKDVDTTKAAQKIKFD
ncbi:ATP-dependent RNA helicase dbp3 [Hyphodiscus hymeniophilus]|uniref:RNA helicase n=1 Tax=Hyphodiscus hymeniophilus TaxID=353542 RepID=A0A9P7B0F0_9HELO|nr:ATP-dependent RNA helicase dbp3 [Hyphodiscus hymeniophilus]